MRTYIHTYKLTYIHNTYIHNSYIHTYIHTCVHTYIHACIPTYIHTHTHTYSYINTYIHTYTHTHTHTHTCDRPMALLLRFFQTCQPAKQQQCYRNIEFCCSCFSNLTRLDDIEKSVLLYISAHLKQFI